MHHSAESWEISLLYFFSKIFTLFWQKGPIKMPNFRLWISPNLYFDRPLLLKVCKILAKIVQRSYVSWYWRMMQNLKKKQFVVLEMTRIGWILVWALKSLKNLYFDWSLLCKACNFWPKKIQRSYLSWHWKSHAKFEEKLTCGLENDMMNLANFHQNTWKCQNVYIHGILLSKVENARAKYLQGSYV